MRDQAAYIRRKLRLNLRNLFESGAIRLSENRRDGLRIFLKIVLRYRWLLFGIFLTNTAAALFEGGTIALLVVAVDVVIAGNDEVASSSLQKISSELSAWVAGVDIATLFFGLVVAAVFAQIMKSVLTYLAKRLAIRLQFGVSRELQDGATKHVMAFSYSEVGKYPAGDLGSLIGRSSEFASLITTANSALLSSLLLMVYFSSMMLLSIKLSLVAFGIAILVGVATTSVATKLRDLGKMIAKEGLVSGRVSFEFLRAPRLIRIFGATAFAEAKINETRRRLFGFSEHATALKAIVEPAIDVVTITAAGSFLAVGYWVAGEDAKIVLPKLLLFLVILNRFMPQVKSLNGVRLSIINSIPLLSSVTEFLRTRDKEMERTGGLPYPGLTESIRFENVTFSYGGRNSPTVLKNVEFEVKKGSTVAIVGPSGAGKSTIADLFLGLYEPTLGKVTVDGVNLHVYDLDSWKVKIGVVDQEVFLLNTTISENIRFAGPDYELSTIKGAARAAYADQFIEAMPDQYESVVGDTGFKLSGGQKQRVALARALIRKPEIVVLDEATSALDSASESFIQETMYSLRNDGITVLVIAHRLSTIAHADEVIVLRDGRIIEKGAPNVLVEKDTVFRKMWLAQSQVAESD